MKYLKRGKRWVYIRGERRGGGGGSKGGGGRGWEVGGGVPLWHPPSLLAENHSTSLPLSEVPSPGQILLPPSWNQFLHKDGCIFFPPVLKEGQTAAVLAGDD